MSKVYYPAIFHVAEDVGGYWVEFPDLPGCFSNGSTIEEAFEMSKEALGLYIDSQDDLYERTFSKPSDIQTVQHNYPNEIVMLVEFDSLKYAQMYKTKAIKKTLTIPEWLNEEAMNKGINFSQVLQEALINKLQSI